MPVQIDFNRIRIHKGSQNRGFEELCFQLIPALCPLPKGTDLVRRGTPDGGIEAHAVLPSGDVWAWQAKYLFALSDSACSQMERSFVEALDGTPKLTRYTFCLPLNRSSGTARIRKGTTRPVKSEIGRWDDYKAKWEQLARDKGMSVKVEYLGESELLDGLVRDPNSGRALYWFDTTILTPDWFKEKFELAEAVADERYTPGLNIDVPLYGAFEGLARTEEFSTDILKELGELRSQRRRWHTLRKVLSENSDLVEAGTKINSQLDSIESQLEDIDVSLAEPVEFDALANVVASARDDIEVLEGPLRKKAREINEREEKSLYDSASYEARRVLEALYSIENFCQSNEAKLVNTPALLIVGEAGTGKTHLMLEMAKRRIRNGTPAVVVLGQHFNDAEPWQQILTQLGLSGTVAEFLGAMESAAEASGCRALILVDAINEGDGLTLWPKHIKAFTQVLRKYPRIGLALSCRNTYVKLILGDAATEFVRVEHYGFRGVELEAIKRFFAAYNLALPEFPLLVPEFQNPLFLKLMCKGLESLGLHSLPRGSSGITRTFDTFLKGVNVRLSKKERLDYDPTVDVITTVLQSLAAEMLSGQKEWLPRSVAEEVCQRVLPRQGWSRSLFAGLIDEGVLSRDPYSPNGTEESVRFAYQRLGQHMMASDFIKQARDLAELSSACQKLLPDRRGSYFNGGLLEALAVQIPEAYKQELHDLVGESKWQWLGEAFLESIIWRSPDAFADPLPLDFLNRLSRDDVLNTLLHVAYIPEHPMNAWMLHRTLAKLRMPDRDTWWSIYLHDTSYDENAISRLIHWAWKEDTSYCSDDSVLLCGIVLTWCFTTSNRFVRDTATKALVSILTGRSEVLRKLLELFRDVNDPYVAQRLYACAYGLCLRSSSTEDVQAIAKLVYDQVFASGRPPVDWLLRDYARGTIEKALQVSGDMEGIDASKTRPPYSSPWPLRVPTLETINRRFDSKEWASISSSVLHWGDFHRYVVEPAISHFEAPNQAKLQAEHKRAEAVRSHEATENLRALVDDDEFQKFMAGETSPLEVVSKDGSLNIFKSLPRGRMKARPVSYDLGRASRWILNRVAELGWTAKRFGDFDSRVRFHDSGRSARKPERIGKKYQWIALHEMMARISDHCRFLKRWSDDSEEWEGPWQTWGRDIDPSLLLEESSNGTWWDTPSNWWATARPNIPYKPSPLERLEWVVNPEGLPRIEDLLQVQHPTEGQMFNTYAYYGWEEPKYPELGDEWEDRCHAWLHIRGYLVHESDIRSFQRWAKGRNWLGRELPQTADSYTTFLGEFPWHQAAEAARGSWVQPEDGPHDHGTPAPILSLAASYRWEKGFDCSIKDTVGGLIPSAEALKLLNAKWTGHDFDYASVARLVALNPSVVDAGPNSLLLSKDALDEVLQREKLAVLWAVAGEKGVYGSMNPKHNDRLEIHGAWCYSAGKLARWDLAFTVLTGDGTRLSLADFVAQGN